MTGFTLAKTFFSHYAFNLSENLINSIYLVTAISAGIIFYMAANKVLLALQISLDKIEMAIHRMTLYELTVSSIGLIVGLIVANLVTIPLNKVAILGVPLSILVNVLFSCLGVAIALGKKNDFSLGIFRHKQDIELDKHRMLPPKVLDTSVIIDGRIIDLCRAGILEGELIVPDFVLEELRHIADSSDALKRNKGRRGLDVLNSLQKDLKHPVRIESIPIIDVVEVDDKLIKAAKKFGGKVLTLDYNLNKVANIQGVPVLNINEIANAVKPIALPGEEMTVQVIKDGRENGQGIGYLEDGTMIVVEGGRKHVGEAVRVIVTSVLQTAAGRMIFAKPKQA
jgi:uncharacterized protein YacL